MKMLFLIPIVSLLCFSCNKEDSCENRSKPQSEQNSPDWEITTKVKAAILADTSISASARFVSVKTMNGTVTLTGSVPTREDQDKIVRIVKKVHGVDRVDNQLTISNR